MNVLSRTNPSALRIEVQLLVFSLQKLVKLLKMIIRKLLETISQGVTVINGRNLLATEYMEQEGN